jgi:hypothetical protein
MPNPGSAPYTSRYNGRAYINPNGNYQSPYTTIAYTYRILLPNHAYQHVPRFNTYGQPEVASFGYETPPQFSFRLQSIDMTPARATAKPGVDPNNLSNQLATILHKCFGTEPKSQARVYQKSCPDYYD